MLHYIITHNHIVITSLNITQRTTTILQKRKRTGTMETIKRMLKSSIDSTSSLLWSMNEESSTNLRSSRRSLEEVEIFLKEHKHLPGVQSRKMVEQEGWNVTEGVRTNLEKIEELFLYVIELKKTTTQLQEENARLRKQLAQERPMSER